MAEEVNVIRRGIYNIEYFSGSQVSLYIGDVWVDEVTTLSYGYHQNRQPIYGYTSTLYDDLSKGQLLIQGTFTVNFKEAGYLWLILNRYRGKMGGSDLLEPKDLFSSSSPTRQSVERFINNELSTSQRNIALQKLAEYTKEEEESVGQQIRENGYINPDGLKYLEELANARDMITHEQTSASLGGFASDTRSQGRIGSAEHLYEAFEDAVWGKPGTEKFLTNRRVDDPALNPFDIYIGFGDFGGDGTQNHTIEKIETVTILGKSKQIIIDGMPIQEQYNFIARELI
jgi:hypothetical protein